MCQELRRARVMDERENKKQTWRAWLVVAGTSRGPRRGPVIVTHNHNSDFSDASWREASAIFIHTGDVVHINPLYTLNHIFQSLSSR